MSCTNLNYIYFKNFAHHATRINHLQNSRPIIYAPGKILGVWHTGKTNVPKLCILLFVSNLFPPSPPFSALNLISAPGKEKVKHTRLAQLCCHHQGENRAVEIKGGATCGNESPPFLGIPPILHATQLCTR